MSLQIRTWSKALAPAGAQERRFDEHVVHSYIQILFDPLDIYERGAGIERYSFYLSLLAGYMPIGMRFRIPPVGRGKSGVVGDFTLVDERLLLGEDGRRFWVTEKARLVDYEIIRIR